MKWHFSEVSVRSFRSFVRTDEARKKGRVIHDEEGYCSADAPRDAVCHGDGMRIHTNGDPEAHCDHCTHSQHVSHRYSTDSIYQVAHAHQRACCDVSLSNAPA